MNINETHSATIAIDRFAYDIEMKILHFLRISEIIELSLANGNLSDLIEDNQLWQELYLRDFNKTYPFTDCAYTPRQFYYLRSISSFMNIDRHRTMNNMLNTMQQSVTVIKPIQASFRLGIWTIEFDKIPGYAYFEDDRGLGMELAYTSNGWFRFHNYEDEQICVYSSSELVPQCLHIENLHRGAIAHSIQHHVLYKWGEWSIISDVGTIYVINNTDEHQALVLSPFEYGFVFYPTDKNPTNVHRIILYPENRIIE